MKKQKSLILLFLAFVMMAITPQSMWALGGSGTQASPYTIASAADLVAFASKVNGSEQAAWGKLTADINLNNAAWTAMGTSNKPYTGTFDGQGHTISGLNLTAKADNAGLFGYVNNATIQNFSLAGSISSGYQNAGSVVGTANGSTKIYNVYSSVNITMTAAKSHIGGIVGQALQVNDKTVEIKGCTYSGTMNLGSSTDSNGGIVGYCYINANIEIEKCFFNGSISTNGGNPRIGGILGYADDDGSTQNFKYIRNCFCDGTLSPSTGDYVGIFAGYPRGKVKDVISNNTYVSTASTNMAGNSTHTTAANNGCKKITISVKANNNTYGSVSQNYVNPTSTAATQLEVVATPNANYYLSSWSDGGAQTHNVALTANVSLTANFKPNPTITVKTNNNTYGTVTGGGQFAYNSTHSIRATANTHYYFVKWDDGNTSTTRSITATEDKTYTAIFAPNQHNITVKAVNDLGTVRGGGRYDYNSKQTIEAIPNPHRMFERWSDGNTDNPRTITVTKDETYSAYFDNIFYQINVVSANPEYGKAFGDRIGDIYGTQIQIYAREAQECHFVRWNDGNTDNPRTIIITGHETYTAIFARNQYALTVTCNNNDYGTLLGSGNYDYGSEQTIEAIPNEHYVFEKWSDGNIENPRTIQMWRDSAFTAEFAPLNYNIQVNWDGYGNEAGNVIGGGSYPYLSEQTIEAIPNEHYVFEKWSDGNTDNPRTITVTGKKTYTAYFIPIKYTITVEYDENYGTVTGSGTYDYGSSQHFVVTPKTHYEFVRWSDSGMGDVDRYITVEGDSTITAEFAPLNYDIYVTSTRPTNCRTIGEGRYPYLSQQTIEAIPDEHYVFERWSDGNTDNPRTITVTRHETYTAVVQFKQYTVTVASNNINYGTVSGGGTTYYSWAKNIYAFPKEHYHLVQWSDGSTQNSRTIYVSGDSTLIAEFAIDQHTISATPNVLDYGTVTGSGTYDYGSVQTLTATPATYFRFVRWDDGNTDNPRQITVSTDNSYTAIFESAIEAKAVFDDNTNTLTFYYDAIEHPGTTYLVPTYTAPTPWAALRSEIETVVFDSNFAAATLGSTYAWFYNFSKLTTIIGLENFNTSSVIDMGTMFYDCSSLQSLDLSSFNTAGVQKMEFMFSGCFNLTSLTIGNFDMQNVLHKNGMFRDCSKLNTLTLKSLPFLADGTFNTQFSGAGKTVNYALDDNSVIYTGTNYLPAASSASYTREMSNEWGTVVVPFEIVYNSNNGNYKLYQFESLNVYNIYFSEYTTGDVIAAGTPMAVKAVGSRNAAGKYEIVLTGNGTISTEINPSGDPVNFYMNGTYTALSNRTDIHFIAQNQFWWADAPITIAPFRAWIEEGENPDTGDPDYVDPNPEEPGNPEPEPNPDEPDEPEDDYELNYDAAPTRLNIVVINNDEQIATSMDAINATADKAMKVMIDGQMFILKNGQMFDICGRKVK